LVLELVSKLTAKKRKDEATIKVLVGVIVFPATWLMVGLGAGRAHELLHQLFPTIPDAGVAAGLVTVVLGILGGILALRYMVVARETLRALEVRLTRARSRINVARMRVERSELCDLIVALGEGLDLPGSVSDDGRVVSS
jgi:hypothetical protein